MRHEGDGETPRAEAGGPAQHWKAACLLLLAAAALIAARAVGQIVLPAYDDAFITYRYARNLARGYGFVYHPGEWVLGTTCPAFGLVVAGLVALRLPVLSSVVALNIAADVATLSCTVWALGRAGRHMAGAFFAFFFALSPIMTRICVGGMEMNLFLLCSLASVLLYHRRASRAAAALAAACYHLRPEAVLLVGILCVEEWLAGRKRNSVWMAVIALGVALPPALVILHYYGHILPQSVIAKSGSVNAPFLVVLNNLLLNDAQSWVLVPFSVWGWVIAVKRRGVARTLAVWGAAYLAAYLAARPHTWSWYGEAVAYVQFVLAALGCADLLGRLPRLAQRVSPARVCVAGSAGVVAAWVGLWALLGPSTVNTDVYRPMKRWCEKTCVAGSSILAEDIGAIGYFSDTRIYDAAGLVWPGALSYRSIPDMILANSPTYLLLNAGGSGRSVGLDPVVRRLYEPVETFSGSRPRRLGPRLLYRSSNWRQEYTLLRRRGSAVANGFDGRGATP